jgi:hypothetical protein
MQGCRMARMKLFLPDDFNRALRVKYPQWNGKKQFNFSIKPERQSMQEIRDKASTQKLNVN